MKKLFLFTICLILTSFCFADDYLYKKYYDTKDFYETIRLKEFKTTEGYELITLTENNKTNVEIIYNILCGQKDLIYDLLFKLEASNNDKETYADIFEKIIYNNERFQLVNKSQDLEKGNLIYTYVYR